MFAGQLNFPGQLDIYRGTKNNITTQVQNVKENL